MSKKTAAAIKRSGNEYVIAVKANQGRLYSALEVCFDSNTINPDSTYISSEFNRGRLALRSVAVISNVRQRLGEKLVERWPGLMEVIQIERMVWRKGKRSYQRAFYISSVNSNALFYSGIIRSHWGIENSLHWVKDVSMGEDGSKIRLGNGAQNMSLIRNIGIDLFRLKGDYGIKRAQRIASNDIAKLKEYCY